MKCPKCKSDKAKVEEYRGTKVIICSKCSYDERDELDITPGQRETQREKGRYTPYRTGGGKRSN